MKYPWRYTLPLVKRCKTLPPCHPRSCCCCCCRTPSPCGIPVEFGPPILGEEGEPVVLCGSGVGVVWESRVKSRVLRESCVTRVVCYESRVLRESCVTTYLCWVASLAFGSRTSCASSPAPTGTTTRCGRAPNEHVPSSPPLLPPLPLPLLPGTSSSSSHASPLFLLQTCVQTAVCNCSTSKTSTRLHGR